jgi:hypothetical protein
VEACSPTEAGRASDGADPDAADPPRNGAKGEVGDAKSKLATSKQQPKQAGRRLRNVISSIQVPSSKEYLGEEKYREMLEKVVAFLGEFVAAHISQVDALSRHLHALQDHVS